MAIHRTPRGRAARRPRSAPPADPLEPIFKAMANADRRRLLDLLRDQPRTSGELCAALPWLDRCTVLLHLRVLQQADLVVVQRQGRVRWNYLNHLPIQQAYRRWIRPYAEPAVELLSTLKQRLEQCE